MNKSENFEFSADLTAQALKGVSVRASSIATKVHPELKPLVGKSRNEIMLAGLMPVYNTFQTKPIQVKVVNEKGAKPKVWNSEKFKPPVGFAVEFEGSVYIQRLTVAPKKGQVLTLNSEIGFLPDDDKEEICRLWLTD